MANRHFVLVALVLSIPNMAMGAEPECFGPNIDASACIEQYGDAFEDPAAFKRELEALGGYYAEQRQLAASYYGFHTPELEELVTRIHQINSKLESLSGRNLRVAKRRSERAAERFIRAGHLAHRLARDPALTDRDRRVIEDRYDREFSHATKNVSKAEQVIKESMSSTQSMF